MHWGRREGTPKEKKKAAEENTKTQWSRVGNKNKTPQEKKTKASEESKLCDWRKRNKQGKQQSSPVPARRETVIGREKSRQEKQNTGEKSNCRPVRPARKKQPARTNKFSSSYRLVVPPSRCPVCRRKKHKLGKQQSVPSQLSEKKQPVRKKNRRERKKSHSKVSGNVRHLLAQNKRD